MRHPASVADLVAFWDFAEPAGEPRRARAGEPLLLHEAFAPVERAAEGVFGPHAATLGPERAFVIPRSEIGGLDIRGPGAQLTLVAWIKPAAQEPEWCRAIAGVWNERTHRRQYCLFTGLGFEDLAPGGEVCGHVSDTGGKSPGHPRCNEAAVGVGAVPIGRWSCVGMTYDGRAIRAWRDGVFTPRAGRNPWPLPGGIFSPPSGEGADFTVGCVQLPDTTRGPRVRRPDCFGNWFPGLIGGLAVWRRALAERELEQLARVGPAGP